jgi:hypothetical protein
MSTIVVTEPYPDIPYYNIYSPIKSTTCSVASGLSCYPPSTSSEGVGGMGVGDSLGTVVGLTHRIISDQPSDITFEALKKLHSLPDNDVRKKELSVCNKFYEYLVACEQKNFYLKGYDTKNGKMVGAKLDYNNRWAPKYRHELSIKLDLLENWFKDYHGELTFISLTGAQASISRSEHWGKINDSRDKLIKLLKYYYRGVQYIWVTEPHMANDSGYVHYHLVVFADVSNNIKDKRGEGMEDKLRRLWSEEYKTGSHTYGLDFKQPKVGMEVKNLKSYLVKYLRKATLIDRWSPGLLIYNAIMWDTGRRAFGASKEIRELMKLPKNKDKDIVWLETRILLPDGEEKIMPGYRLYIPEWIDSPMWSDLLISGIDPPKTYIYDWGRKTSSDWNNRVYEYRWLLKQQKETRIYYKISSSQ